MPSRQVFRIFSPRDLPKDMTLKQGEFVKKNSTQRSDPSSSPKFNAVNVSPKIVPMPTERRYEGPKSRINRDKPEEEKKVGDREDKEDHRRDEL